MVLLGTAVAHAQAVVDLRPLRVGAARVAVEVAAMHRQDLIQDRGVVGPAQDQTVVATEGGQEAVVPGEVDLAQEKEKEVDGAMQTWAP